MIYYLKGMNGLGDTFYQRAVVRRLSRVNSIVLQTSWPQLFAGISRVQCVRSTTDLRTQSKNIARNDLGWLEAPTGAQWQTMGYRATSGESMLQSMMRSVGIQQHLEPIDFQGPPVTPSVRERPYIVVRPSTLRREWMAPGRNPHPGYIAAVVDRLRAHYTVIVVADIDPPAEWAAEPVPRGDENYLHGELSLEQLLSLVAGAAGLVGGVGWLLPAALAYKVPMLVVYGGWGSVNGPSHTLDPRIDSRCLVHALPDHFCMCSDKHHHCDKTISPNLWTRYHEQFAQLIGSRQTRVVA